MSYFLKLLLSLLLIPVFLILLLLSIPILMLITCVASRSSRNVQVKTFTAVWPPEPKQNERGNRSDENVYDVDCTVISSTPLEKDRNFSGDDSVHRSGKPSSLPTDKPYGSGNFQKMNDE